MIFNHIKKLAYLLNKIINELCINIILPFKKFKLENSIIIFSEARGGSTWLMHILHEIPNSCINWEPLHPKHGVVPSDYSWGWRPYLFETEKNPKYIRFFEGMFVFKIHSRWTRKYLSGTDLLGAKYVITKFVRANRLIPFFIKNFSFRLKPILLIRHPIDVCLSQIKTFQTEDQNKLAPQNLSHSNNHQLDGSTKEFLSQLKTELEIKVATWCINNISSLHYPDLANHLTIIFYSDLIINPTAEIRKIFKVLNVPEEITSTIDFRESSDTTIANINFKGNPELQLHKNFNNLEQGTKDKIQAIFDYFNFKLYDAYSPFPHKEVLKVL